MAILSSFSTLTNCPNYGVHYTEIIGNEPTREEAEYVLNFVINSIIQIENLDDDILKAHNNYN